MFNHTLTFPPVLNRQGKIFYFEQQLNRFLISLQSTTIVGSSRDQFRLFMASHNENFISSTLFANKVKGNFWGLFQPSLDYEFR